MTYCFDLDNTLCRTPGTDYKAATPLVDRIKYVNQPHSQGHRIWIDTARGSGSGIDWEELTLKQLKYWGVKFHRLRCGIKFAADYFIDDKGFNAEDFFGKTTGN